MSIVIIESGHDLINEVCSCLEGIDADYSSNLVVFPNKRPSYFLKKALSQKEGRSLVLPLILSMDEFVDFVYQEVLCLSKKRLSAMDCVAILYDIHKTGYMISKGNFISPDAFFPIGLKIYQDLEELHIEKTSLSKIKDIDPFLYEKIPSQTLSRLQSISYFYEEFYRRIEHEGLSTRASRYRTIADLINEDRLSSFKKIIFSGFFGLTRTEMELFSKLYKFGSTVFVFQKGKGVEEIIYKTFGIVPEIKGQIEAQQDIRGIEKKKSPEIYFYKSPDTHGQFFALSNILNKKLLEGESLDENTVIVLPSSDSLFPLMHNCLSLFKEDQYNISMGYPLYRTPVFGFLNSLMDLITSVNEDRFYIPDYLRFVLHPYTKNIYFDGRADITRILFHAIEERLVSKKTMTFLRLEDIEDDDEFLRFIMERVLKSDESVSFERLSNHIRTIHDSTIKKFLSFENVGDFAKKCIEVLYYIYENSTARYHALFYPFSEAFIKSLDEISSSIMKDVSFEHTVNYFNLFKSYIKTCHVPFLGAPLRGLQVLGLLETRNIKFERVFILDLNEGIVPDARKEDTLLPLKARQMLNLPTYTDRERLIEYYFNGLISGAKEVNIFFVENERLEMSRFAQKLIWERQVQDLSEKTSSHIKSVQYRTSLRSKTPKPISKTKDMVDFLKGYAFSATSLDNYLKCQLRFFYKHVLNLEEKEDFTGDVEKSDIGKVVHKILAEYFRGLRGKVLKDEDLDTKRMADIADEIFEKEYGKELIGANYLLKQQIKKRMLELLGKYYMPMTKEHKIKVLNVEEEIGISKNSFNLKGRIDLIEERDKRIFIIDYKTSANPVSLEINFDKLDLDKREQWSDFVGSLQLPFYHLIYTEHANKKIEDVNCAFLMLGRTAIDKNIELPLFNEDERREKALILTKLIFKLLNEIVDIAQPFMPTQNKKEVCKFCDFRQMCGTL